jgi:DNA-binding NarL/FixJ family response regulator
MTTTTDQLRLLLVDAHPAVREAVRRRLEAVPRFKVVGEAGDTHEAFVQLEKTGLHLAVIDISLGNTSGLFLAREIARRYAEIRTLIWSMHSNADYLTEAKDAGVRGYVLKSRPTEEIVKAIEVVAAGGHYYSADIEQVSVGMPRLTQTEHRILKLVASGKTSRGIAKLLKISPRTVETHRGNVMNKLGATSTVEMVIIAYRRGLIDFM